MGAINALGLAKRLKARVLQASTSEVYGDPDVHPQPESYRGSVNLTGIRACYDEGNRCAETLFYDYRPQHNLDFRVARIFNTYGPRMHPKDGRVISNFIIQTLKNEPITIYGDGSQTRSFCFVDDLIKGLVLLMNKSGDLTEPVNLGNPAEITIKRAAEEIIALTGSRSRLEYRPLCLRTIRGSAARILTAPANSSIGALACRSRPDWSAPSRISSACLQESFLPNGSSSEQRKRHLPLAAGRAIRRSHAAAPHIG
jgi:nucleoside-diphosphate-sugar epimerase